MIGLAIHQYWFSIKSHLDWTNRKKIELKIFIIIFGNDNNPEKIDVK
jgi:hypothetical protein